MSQNPSSLEYENLEVHVDKCAMRYEGLEQRFEQVETRLDNIDKKVDELRQVLTDGHQNMTKVLIATAGTVIAGLLSTIVVIIVQ